MELTADTPNPSEARSGSGYFNFMGHLQIWAGALTILFSCMTLGMALIGGDSVLFNPEALGAYSTAATMVSLYLAFQINFGWIFGVLLLLSGIGCLKSRWKPLVKVSAIVNLLNFPHGTTIALMTLHGLNRQRSEA